MKRREPRHGISRGWCGWGGQQFWGEQKARFGLRSHHRVPCPGCRKPIVIRDGMMGVSHVMIPHHKVPGETP